MINIKLNVSLQLSDNKDKIQNYYYRKNGGEGAEKLLSIYGESKEGIAVFLDI